MNVIQGLLAPWMTGGSPSALDSTFSNYGGTQGLLSALMQGAGPDTSQARTGAAMQNAQLLALKQAQARQQLAQGTIGLQQNMAMFPILMGALRGYAGGGNPPAQTPTAPSSSAPAAGQPPAGNAVPMTSPGPSAVPAASSGGQLSSGLNLARVLSLMGRPGADTFLRSLTADPGYITQSAVAKDPLIVDRSMVYDAYRRGDMQGAQQAYFKLLKDSGQVTVDRYGNVVTLGGIKPTDLGVSTFLPQQGLQTTGGVMSAIPGAVPTRQALSAAESVGRAAGDVEKVTDANGNEYFVPRSALLGGAGQSQAGGARGSATSTPFQAALGPASAELLKGKGEQAAKVNEEFQDKAEAGNQMLAQIAELRSAAHDFTPGQFAESRMKMLQWMQTTGLITKDEMNRLGSAQEGQKIAIQLQAAATKQLGSREAAQIFTYMGKSLPNLTLSPDGLEKVSAYMEGISRYDIARAQVAQHRMAQNDVNGLNATRDDFIKNTNPLYFIVASAAPAQRAEMLKSMGAKANSFLQAWNDAANAGWAPRPNQYGVQ